MTLTGLSRDDAARLAARIYAFVRACPSGRVTTYGWIGAAVGYPKGARMVGWVMNESPRWESVPAQRVISAKGVLTGSWAFGQKGRMRRLLEDEGIVFDDEGRVDMARYGWDPSHALSDEERVALFARADAAPEPVSDHLYGLLLDDPASPFRITPAAQPSLFDM